MRQFSLKNDSYTPKVLAIIPARGGSKGLRRKNIRDLCGKPLVAYTIEAALKAKLIDRVVVSTEDKEISEISKSFGAEVPFLRPPEMAGDNSNIKDALTFTLNKIRANGYYPDIVVTLFPTHPFRTPNLIDYLIHKIIDGYGQVSTVKPVTHNPFSFFFKNRAKKFIPLFFSHLMNKNNLPKTYFRIQGLFLGSDCIGSENPYLYVIKDPVQLIDIDFLQDFYLAEEVIKEGLFDFESN